MLTGLLTATPPPVPTPAPDPFALPAFIIAIISLTIAFVGAATGIAALIWQMVTRTRGAHRIKVTVDKVVFANDRPPGTQIRVVVANVGAASVQVISWSIERPDGGGYVQIAHDDDPSTPLPYRLEAGSHAFFLMPARSLNEMLARNPGMSANELRAMVRLGTGQVVRSKKGIPLDPATDK